MIKPVLLAIVGLSLAGCAGTGAEPGTAAKKERVADAYTPTGTFIPRKKSERGAVNTSEVDKQAFENDRLTSPSSIPMGQ